MVLWFDEDPETKITNMSEQMCEIYFGFTAKALCELWYFKILEYVEYWTQS